MAAPLFTEYDGHASTTFVVTSNSELDVAIKSLASGSGGTIKLDAAGAPYQVSASNIGSADAPILFTSLDPDNQAVISELVLTNTSYMTFDNLAFDHSSEGTDFELSDYDIRVIDSEHVEFTSNSMTGTANGMATYDASSNNGGSLAFVKNSSDLLFSGNVISEYFHGVAIFDSQNVVLTHNEVHSMQGDGFRGGGIEGGIISHNYFHDFYGAIQTITHNDMIQLWGTSVSTENKDILIDSNILDSGTGAATQGIFIRNETFGEGGVASGYFENITITNNTIYNGMPHGINLSNTLNGLVANNTVLWNEDAGFYKDAATPLQSYGPWIFGVDSPGTVFADNAARIVSLNGEHLHDTNLALNYTDPTSDSYALKHIVNAGLGDEATLNDLALSPSSPYYGLYGAAIKEEFVEDDTASSADAASATPKIVTASISINAIEGARDMLRLSAEGSLADGKLIDPDTTEVVWTLSDGRKIIGENVIVDFGAGGSHDVTVSVTAIGGATDTATTTVELKNEDIVAADFATPSATEKSKPITAYESEDKLSGLRLDGENSYVFDRDDFDMFGLDTVEIDMDFRLDTSAETEGSVVRLAGSFSMNTYYHGGFKFRLVTEDGAFEVFAPAGTLSDGETKNIKALYDGPAGFLRLSVDDEVVGEIAASGSTTSGAYNDLVLGSSFGSGAQGYIESFSLSSPQSSVAPEATEIQDPSDSAIVEETAADPTSDVIELVPTKESVVVEDDESTFNALPEEKIQQIPVYREYTEAEDSQLTSSASWQTNGFLGNTYASVGGSASSTYSEIPAVKTIAVAFGVDAAPEAELNDAQSMASILEMIREADFDWKDASVEAGNASLDGQDAYTI